MQVITHMFILAAESNFLLEFSESSCLQPGDLAWALKHLIKNIGVLGAGFFPFFFLQFLVTFVPVQ